MSLKIISPAVQIVDAQSQSFLPTGSLKIEDGQLYQEVLIITHRPTKDRPVGIRNEWMPFPKEIMEYVKVAK